MRKAFSIRVIGHYNKEVGLTEALLMSGEKPVCCLSKLNAGWFPLGTAVQMLGFALMAGGMLALGAFTAPAVFGQLPRDSAAPVMALIFRRYDVVLLIALLLVVVGEAIRLASKQMVWHPKLGIVRGFLLLALTGTLLYSTTIINPQIARLNQAGVHRNLLTPEGREFEKQHKLSESLYKLELLSAVLLILLTPFAGKPNRGLENHV